MELYAQVKDFSNAESTGIHRSGFRDTSVDAGSIVDVVKHAHNPQITFVIVSGNICDNLASDFVLAGGNALVVNGDYDQIVSQLPPNHEAKRFSPQPAAPAAPEHSPR